MSNSDTVDPSLPLDRTDEQPVPLASRIVHKFFEPIVLLVALTDAVRDNAKPQTREPDLNVQDLKQLFFAFENKLCHVCDREKGGATVTSFVILRNQENPDKSQFVFAMNQQNENQLRTTKAYVETLLHKVRQAPEGRGNQDNVRRSLLYDILRFNRPRASFYLRDLRNKVAECLRICEVDKTVENDLIAEELADILSSPPAGSSMKDAETDYVNKCKETIRFLTRIDQSRAGKIIQERAQENRMAGHRSMECWGDLLHVMKRILAYQHSVQFFLLAKENWPILFENFAVDFISSSHPIAKPIRNKSLSAESMVGRMTRKEDEMKKFREFVQTLQAFDLDGRIKQEYGRDSFKPIVHSEVLLLNWLSTQDDIVPSRFFNYWKYIGSSKPTCKLCDYYFQVHTSEVEHRFSHGNLYSSWRVPDVFPHQGPEGTAARQTIVDKLLRKVRKDAFDVVATRVSPGKKHDTDTNTCGLSLFDLQSSLDGGTDVDNVSLALARLGINQR